MSSFKDWSPSWPPWSLLNKQPSEVQIEMNRKAQFSGKKRWDGSRFYYRPQHHDPEQQKHAALEDDDYGGSLTRADGGKYVYRNQFGLESNKFSDVAVYLSPTNFTPKRLVVQSTNTVLHHDLSRGDWRRCKIKGHVPLILVICEWALHPFRQKAWYRRVDGCARVLLVSIPVQIMVVLPYAQSWDDGDSVDTYTDFAGYHWQWPKHAINPLDERPREGATSLAVSRRSTIDLKLSPQRRLLRPRQMVVRQSNETWKVVASVPASLPYVFISYADKAFSTDSGRRRIQEMAERATLEAGCEAYWLDFLCRAPTAGDLLDLDVYCMCDVVRSSSRVVVMLPDDRMESKITWGSRMWTLPEALLAPGHQTFFCQSQGDGIVTESLSLVQISSHLWPDKVDDDETSGPSRLLAEHFTNQLSLGRLELFSLAASALYQRSLNSYTFFTVSDVAYALMGLLHYRIPRDRTDTEFQSLARLSLLNDSDRIVERMLSLYPPLDKSACDPFFTLDTVDQYHTHLWDIEPTCQVVGVAHEDNTVLVDSCRAMHIRWKDFPRPVVTRDTGFMRLFAIILISMVTWWLAKGFSLAIYYAPLFISNLEPDTKSALKFMIAGFLIIALILSCFGPSAVRRLYGGRVLQSTSNLVGFEGVMPIARLEKIIFGQNHGRLSYEASSGPYAERYRDKNIRVGLEPKWVKVPQHDVAPDHLPPTHRLFTLVDTGELTVTIFSAERPPTVALLCGREGGMLRAVLCSWQFENDCLYKESVLRMPSNVWDSAKPKSWLKLCLKTMNQARRGEHAERQRRASEAFVQTANGATLPKTVQMTTFASSSSSPYSSPLILDLIIIISSTSIVERNHPFLASTVPSKLTSRLDLMGF